MCSNSRGQKALCFINRVVINQPLLVTDFNTLNRHAVIPGMVESFMVLPYSIPPNTPSLGARNEVCYFPVLAFRQTWILTQFY